MSDLNTGYNIDLFEMSIFEYDWFLLFLYV